LRAFWKDLLKNRVETPEELAAYIDIDVQPLKKVTKVYPMRINSYFLQLMLKKGSSLSRQVVPDIRELYDSVGEVDPLAEERDSPVPNLTHRYPDRVLFLVSSECGVYCRFCTRKRKIGRWGPIKDEQIEEGFHYLRDHKEVRDVLLSGGDPLLLSDKKLEWILARVREISHVEIIRIGTRVPSVLPQRIIPKLVEILKKYHPLYINVHFNHPDEVTKEAEKACALLADGGIPLGNQTVLLRNVNDSPEVIGALMKLLLKMRVKPYYLHQADLTRGTDHFRTPIETGLRIMQYLRGRVSGLAVPTYAIDLPGGGGKVPVLPEYVIGINEKEVILKNYLGKIYKYPQPSFIPISNAGKISYDTKKGTLPLKDVRLKSLF